MFHIRAKEGRKNKTTTLVNKGWLEQISPAISLQSDNDKKIFLIDKAFYCHWHTAYHNENILCIGIQL